MRRISEHGGDDHRNGRCAGSGGFALVEVLVAIAILSVGLLGLGSAMALQGGIAEGASTGAAAVNRGYYASTAVLLAQERLEQARRLTYTCPCPPGTDQLASPPADFPFSEATVSGFPGFSREVTVEAYPAGTAMKTVTVTVRFNRPTAAGMTADSVVLTTIIAARP